MRVVPGNAQHIGARKEQQDAFGFSDPSDRSFVAHGGILAIVCDGMGGHANGREAAQGAVRAFLETYAAKDPDEVPEEAMARALSAANEEVRRIARESGQEGNCGSTLVSAAIVDNRLLWTSVGDSRIYLYDGRGLRLLTEDQIYARRLEAAVRQGLLSEEDAARHPDREALTSYVGIEELREVCQGELADALAPGAAVLLCSDGLYKNLSDEDILALFDPDPNRWAEILVRSTLDRRNSHQDNITVAVLAVDPPVSSSTTLRVRRGGLRGSEPSSRSGRRSLWIALMLLFLGGAVWGVWHWREGPRQGGGTPPSAIVTQAPPVSGDEGTDAITSMSPHVTGDASPAASGDASGGKKSGACPTGAIGKPMPAGKPLRPTPTRSPIS